MVTKVVNEKLNEEIRIAYDDLGQRVSKKHYKNSNLLKATIYVRDASGSVMSIYEHDSSNLKQLETPVYGAGRVGVAKRNTLGGERYNYAYEVTDHLGNVRAVVARDVSSKYFSDYFPFGMLVPNRSYDDNDYRYGFQGQEKDNEVKGEGNSINYKFRMHDPRAGRFFATDPLEAEYPHNSPYAFSENRVMDGIELEGREWLGVTYTYFSIEASAGAFTDGIINIRQSGVARDEVGKTHFIMVRSGEIDGTNAMVFGGGVSVSGGFEQSFKAETFLGDQRGATNAMASVGLGAGLGGQVAVGYKRFAAEIGFGAEARVQVSTTEIEFSISLTDNEADSINSKSYGNGSWGITNVSKKADENGNYWADVTIDSGNDTRTTTQRVFSTDKKQWMSENYYQQATEAEENDN